MNGKSIKCRQCGALSENPDINPKAWNGWTIAPRDAITCPACVAKALREKGFEIRLGQENGKKFVYLHFTGVQA
jgi:ribosomal protein L40E